MQTSNNLWNVLLAFKADCTHILRVISWADELLISCLCYTDRITYNILSGLHFHHYYSCGQVLLTWKVWHSIYYTCELSCLRTFSWLAMSSFKKYCWKIQSDRIISCTIMTLEASFCAKCYIKDKCTDFSNNSVLQ